MYPLSSKFTWNNHVLQNMPEISKAIHSVSGKGVKGHVLAYGRWDNRFFCSGIFATTGQRFVLIARTNSGDWLSCVISRDLQAKTCQTVSSKAVPGFEPVWKTTI